MSYACFLLGYTLIVKHKIYRQKCSIRVFLLGIGLHRISCKCIGWVLQVHTGIYDANSSATNIKSCVFLRGEGRYNFLGVSYPQRNLSIQRNSSRGMRPSRKVSCSCSRPKTLRKTNSLPLKMGRSPAKRKQFPNHHFSGASC